MPLMGALLSLPQKFSKGQLHRDPQPTWVVTIRHCLRCLQWKHWKIYRRRKAELIKRGINPKLAHTTAWSAKGPWKISHTPGVRMARNNQFFDRMGLIRLSVPRNR